MNEREQLREAPASAVDTRAPENAHKPETDAVGMPAPTSAVLYNPVAHSLKEPAPVSPGVPATALTFENRAPLVGDPTQLSDPESIASQQGGEQKAEHAAIFGSNQTSPVQQERRDSGRTGGVADTVRVGGAAARTPIAPAADEIRRQPVAADHAVSGSNAPEDAAFTDALTIFDAPAPAISHTAPVPQEVSDDVPQLSAKEGVAQELFPPTQLAADSHDKGGEAARASNTGGQDAQTDSQSAHQTATGGASGGDGTPIIINNEAEEPFENARSTLSGYLQADNPDTRQEVAIDALRLSVAQNQILELHEHQEHLSTDQVVVDATTIADRITAEIEVKMQDAVYREARRQFVTDVETRYKTAAQAVIASTADDPLNRLTIQTNAYRRDLEDIAGIRVIQIDNDIIPIGQYLEADKGGEALRPDNTADQEPKTRRRRRGTEQDIQTAPLESYEVRIARAELVIAIRSRIKPETIASEIGKTEAEVREFASGEQIDLSQGRGGWSVPTNERNRDLQAFYNSVNEQRWFRTFAQLKSKPKTRIAGTGLKLLRLAAHQKQSDTISGNATRSRYETGGEVPSAYNLKEEIEASGLDPSSKAAQLLLLYSANVNIPLGDQDNPMTLNELQTCDLRQLTRYLRRLKGVTQEDVGNQNYNLTSYKNFESRAGGGNRKMSMAAVEAFIQWLDLEEGSALAKILREKQSDQYREQQQRIGKDELRAVLKEQYLFQEHLDQLEPYDFSEQEQSLHDQLITIKERGGPFREMIDALRAGRNIKDFAEAVHVSTNTLRYTDVQMDETLIRILEACGLGPHNPDVYLVLDYAEQQRAA